MLFRLFRRHGDVLFRGGGGGMEGGVKIKIPRGDLSLDGNKSRHSRFQSVELLLYFIYINHPSPYIYLVMVVVDSA